METSVGSRVIDAIVGVAGLIGLFLLPKLHTTTTAPYAHPV